MPHCSARQCVYAGPRLRLVAQGPAQAAMSSRVLAAVETWGRLQLLGTLHYSSSSSSSVLSPGVLIY
jgi:hypothetical protein